MKVLASPEPQSVRYTLLGEEKTTSPLIFLDDCTLHSDETLTKLYGMFEDVIDILDSYAIEYHLHCGTLLGALRHGGVIPWDDDIDLCYHYKDHNKVVESMRRLLDRKKYRFIEIVPGSKINMKGTCLGLDLMMMGKHPENGKYCYAYPIKKNTATFMLASI